MRLICVKAILDIEEGKCNLVDRILKQFNDHELANIQYAILSHCWGKNDEEVKFKEMEGLPKMRKKARDLIKRRPGYKKIVGTCEQARKDGLEWVWVDTCCIDKESSAELSEAINSMYQWYGDAGKCYAYLHDVEERALPTGSDEGKFAGTDGWPKWFSRGWTLQELIAPDEVIFFNTRWEQLEDGTKAGLARTLYKITGIPTSILQYGLDSEQPCAAQIMSWAANRKTTRVEDSAYSLMGLFGVYMPMLYGEGRNAFRRLQLEILQMTNDHSIFAWNKEVCGNVLAEDVRFFENCGDVVRMEPEEYRQVIEKDIPKDTISKEQLLTCSITNAGIQIWLPVRQFEDSNFFEATLACRNTFGPVRIPLALIKSKHHRYHGYRGDGEPLQFQQLFLAYSEKVQSDNTVFKVNNRSLAQHGFFPEHIYPEDMTVTESISLSANRYAAMSYSNQRTDTRFAVLFGSIAAQAWAHLTVPRRSSFKNYAKAACFDMWSASSKQAHMIAETGKTGKGYCLVKRLHLSCSISDIRLILQRLPQQNSYSITLDIVQCAGCCLSNDRWQALDIIPGGEGCMLGDVRAVLASNEDESLLVNRIPTTFARDLSEPGFELGDFGNWNNENFEREGNVFDYQASMALVPVQHDIRNRWESNNKGDYVKFGKSPTLCLRKLQCLSLPDDENIKELLKALSTHLQGKSLVTTVVRCSELHIEKSFTWDMWPNYDESEASDFEWQKVPVFVPLFVLTRPLVWYGEKACKDTRAYFEQIRKHFSVLSKPSDLRVPDIDAAVNFLSTLFGAEDLKDYIGEIEYFRRIRAVRCDHTKRDSPVGSDKEIQSPEIPCTGTLSQVGTAYLDLRIESLAQSLVQNLPIPMDNSTDDVLLRRDRHDGQIAWRAVDKVFGSEVLRLIATAYQKPWRLRRKSDSDRKFDDEFEGNQYVNSVISCDHEACHSAEDNRDEDFMVYNCIKILFRQVEELQTRLDECEDDDAKRALEEDITGKILLACCRGVYHELTQVLSKVVDRLIHENDAQPSVQDSQAMFFYRIGRIFYDMASESKFYHFNHLWRITADARAGVSKHELLMGARKHSEAKLAAKQVPVADQTCDIPCEEGRPDPTT